MAQLCVGRVAGAQTAKTFVDYIKPAPIVCSPLSSATWGVAGVLPRDTCQGIESAQGAGVPPADYYWDGQIIKANDGKYHMFMSTWPGSSAPTPRVQVALAPRATGVVVNAVEAPSTARRSGSNVRAATLRHRGRDDRRAAGERPGGRGHRRPSCPAGFAT